eukprot:TRINITY_DN1452_c0_g1_i1.p1 TRINITY_DN1452_c0_g1~~TRINITY_DN1452_c0_g1_i1.p1  ORF type:complete len:410 (+),score=89.01 TRINITY_DN1452_c0_g1_i1:160-1389(+)
MERNTKGPQILDSPSGTVDEDGVSFKHRVERVEYIEFWVGNAKVAQKFFSNSFGFTHVAVRGLETGEKMRTSHVIVQNDAKFVFTSTLRPDDREFNEHLSIHGDAIRDVALQVDDVHAIYEQAISNGAKSLEAPHEERDENGVVVLAKIAAPYGDTVHTLVDRSRYTGVFLPGFKRTDGQAASTGGRITNIDHIALAYGPGKMLDALKWYIECLGFHQFLCNDEDTDEGLTIKGMEGGLKTIVAASSQEKCALKFVFVEAMEAEGTRKKNQISEFVEYNGGRDGVHHIALHTDDIIETVDALKNRGVEFITVPASYYEDLFAREGYHVQGDPQKLQELGILMDISHKKASQGSSTPNFMLQTFTVPLQDRPTFFFEIILRKGSRGFGDRTIKALFEAIERLQAKRTATE